MIAPLTIPSGCVATKAIHDHHEIWLITTSKGNCFVAREMPNGECRAWSDLQAMRGGEGRVIIHAPVIESLVEALDGFPTWPTDNQNRERIAELPPKEQMMPTQNSHSAFQNLRDALRHLTNICASAFGST